MIEVLKPLENSLNKFYLKSTPELPKNAKKNIVEYLPWISLILGVLSIFLVFTLWSAAHVANIGVNYINQVNAALGNTNVVVNRLGVGIWISLIILLVEAIIFIMAFNPTKAKKKSGWDLLFYGALINVIYGLVISFTFYGTFANLIGSLIGAFIGFYFLFQIRESYVKKASENKQKV